MDGLRGIQSGNKPHPLVREVVPERKREEADNTPIDGQIGLEELK